MAKNKVSLNPGDGFVFDAGEDRNDEQGGMVWKVEGKKLFFDRRSGINWKRVHAGQGLWKTSDPGLEKEVKKSWKGGRLEEKGDSLMIQVSGRSGEPLVLECRGKKVASEVILEKAERRPLTKEILAGQLGRLGGTEFQLGLVQNSLEGEVMIPLGELNRVRRRLVEELKEVPVVKDGGPVLARLMPERGVVDEGLPELRVLCRSLEQVEGCARAGAGFIYCDFEDVKEYREAVEMARKGRMKVFLATPRIQKPSEVGFFNLVEKAKPDGVLVRNLGGISYFKDRGILAIADFSLNVANPVSAALLMRHGEFENLTVSYDLNEGQVSELLASASPEWFELTVHQHMPMFHMEHCVFCTFLSNGTSIKDCGKPCETHHVQLRDRVGQLHTLTADVGCRNTLFNGRAQTGVGSAEGFQKLGLKRFRLELLEEDEGDAQRLVNVYRRFFAKERSARDVASQLGAIERLGVTKGTLEQRREEVHR